jgi:hypothetical protein
MWNTQEVEQCHLWFNFIAQIIDRCPSYWSWRGNNRRKIAANINPITHRTHRPSVELQVLNLFLNTKEGREMGERLRLWEKVPYRQKRRGELRRERSVSVPQFLWGEDIPPAFYRQYNEELMPEAKRIFAHYDLISWGYKTMEVVHRLYPHTKGRHAAYDEEVARILQQVKRDYEKIKKLLELAENKSQ